MIFYGKPVAEKIYEKIEKEKQGLREKPFLAILLVGNDPASLSYVHLKEKIAARLGFGFKIYHFLEDVKQEELEGLITDLNNNNSVSGIVVQLPLPASIDTEKIIGGVKKEKDIDGFLGSFVAPTAQAILDILDYYQIDLNQKKIVIVGHGRLVGQPLERILKSKNIDATVCDSKTENLKDETLQADVLISATGVPGLISPEMVKKDTIVIDAGSSEANGKMVGDVVPGVYEKITDFTPNPGGVGPVTVAELFFNLVKATK